MMDSILLFSVGTLAGVLNSVAGGGSFFTFPALLLTGMNPIVANATSTMAVWPGSVASVFAYRSEVGKIKHRVPGFVVSSLTGGIIGSLILLKTPEQTFSGLIPYLLLFATILFICGGKINQFLRNKHSFRLGNFPAWCLQLCIAIYGGYFGAGAGIVMLAMLALTGMEDIHEMNAIKTILGVSINAVAVTIFIIAGIIAWQPALTMMGGAIAGGYFGAIYAKKLPQKVVRGFVIFSASAMTIYFFIR